MFGNGFCCSLFVPIIMLLFALSSLLRLSVNLFSSINSSCNFGRARFVLAELNCVSFFFQSFFWISFIHPFYPCLIFHTNRFNIILNHDYGFINSRFNNFLAEEIGGYVRVCECLLLLMPKSKYVQFDFLSIGCESHCNLLMFNAYKIEICLLFLELCACVPHTRISSSKNSIFGDKPAFDSHSLFFAIWRIHGKINHTM